MGVGWAQHHILVLDCGETYMTVIGRFRSPRKAGTCQAGKAVLQDIPASGLRVVGRCSGPLDYFRLLAWTDQGFALRQP